MELHFMLMEQLDLNQGALLMVELWLIAMSEGLLVIQNLVQLRIVDKGNNAGKNC